MIWYDTFRTLKTAHVKHNEHNTPHYTVGLHEAGFVGTQVQGAVHLVIYLLRGGREAPIPGSVCVTVAEYEYKKKEQDTTKKAERKVDIGGWEAGSCGE